MMMQSLDDIGLYHGTDQSSAHHDYLRVLEKYFAPRRLEKLKLLEIGLAGGRSVLTWHDYFPHARIWAIDHNPEYVGGFQAEIDMRRTVGERVTLRCGNAHHRETWKELPLFDIVIDDGGHESAVILETLDIGFDFLAPGGLWIVEDLHAVYAEPVKKPVDAIGYFKARIDHLNELGLGQCGKPQSSAPLAAMHFYKSLVILERR